MSRADEVNPPQQVEGVGPPMEWEGESGLVLMVPGAEPIVRELRYRFDPAAAAGVGAHITVLYPFVPLDSLDGGVEQAVALVAAGHGAFDFELTAVRAWPDVVYLSMKPEAPVRALTGAMAARWPDHPPYGGAFDDIVPHLTIGHGGEDLLAEAEAAVSPGMVSRVTHPFATRGSAGRGRGGGVTPSACEGENHRGLAGGARRGSLKGASDVPTR